MTGFVARQQQLVRHLKWGPSRGEKRRAYAQELRALVREELQRELAVKSALPQRPDDQQSEPTLFGRRAPWWVDQ